ncbi:unnamed protein product [Closterium sp. NIES-64]|nr:unnamed protein product [Closterium sp. NIES-64]
MFKKFSNDEVAGQNQLKASVQRKIRQSIAEEYPSLDSVLEDLLPKKSPIVIAKCPNHVSIVVMNNVPLFFNVRDGPFMPTLRLLHQYPDMMRKMQVDTGAIKPANPHLPLFANTPPLLPPFPLPPDPDMMRKMQVDRGAIKFVMSGANIMCPGLTSPGGKMDDGIPTDSPVAIFAEGKENALAIGYTKMSSDDIRKINKGIGVDLMHYLNDGLWKVQYVEGLRQRWFAWADMDSGRFL